MTQKSSPLIGNAVTIQHQRLEAKMRVRVTLERNIWESEYLHLNVVYVHCWKTQCLCFWFFGDRISFCFKYFFFWFFSSSTGWRYADCCIWSGPTTHTFLFQFKTRVRIKTRNCVKKSAVHEKIWVYILLYFIVRRKTLTQNCNYVQLCIRRLQKNNNATKLKTSSLFWSRLKTTLCFSIHNQWRQPNTPSKPVCDISINYNSCQWIVHIS